MCYKEYFNDFVSHIDSMSILKYSPAVETTSDPSVKNIGKKYEIYRFYLITQKPLKIAKKLWYTKRKINKFPKFWYRSELSSTIFNKTATETAAHLLYSKKRPTRLFY